MKNIQVKTDSSSSSVPVYSQRQHIIDLNDELSQVMLDASSWKSKMERNREYYKHSAFFAPKSGKKVDSNISANYIKVFVDKNIDYTSAFPEIKVPTTGGSPEKRQSASIREKILYATHRASGSAANQKRWAFDATVSMCAIANVKTDFKNRCVKVRRIDPRYAFWQYSNDNDQRVIAFWEVFPITKAECKKRYGVEPTQSLIDPASIEGSQTLSRLDGQDWFLMAIRSDESTREAWVGDKILEEKHNHLENGVPYDICMPFFDGSVENRGASYIDALVPLQAEYNETLRQMASIARRLGSPVVWGRGIVARQFEDAKKALSKPGGGFVPLKAQGELGVLQINDTKMLDNHAVNILTTMMRISGFGAAAFGEAGGANSSGDALSMVFNPTQRAIDTQNIDWTAFHESINAKILRSLYNMLKPKETISLSGYAPSRTILSITDENGKKKNQLSYGGFEVEFDKSVIDQNYTSVVMPKPVTPRDENAKKRLALEGASQGIISRTTAYEEWGILSPEDELELLRMEQQDPAINPEGTSQLMTAASKMQPPQEGIPTNVQPDQPSS